LICLELKALFLGVLSVFHLARKANCIKNTPRGVFASVEAIDSTESEKARFELLSKRA
jgi:hypothetical protein